MKLPISNTIFLSDITPSDKPAFLQHLQEKEIYDRTLRIPYPYTEKDADYWIAFLAEQAKSQGSSQHWAIRNEEGFLIGVIGFENLAIGKSHRAEVGYWLAKPWWGRGIMTDVVKGICAHAFSEFGLVRIIATTFVSNAASARVLEKAGFALEGVMKKYHCKEGRFIDAKLYALIR